MQAGGGPAGRFTAREVLDLLMEGPDDSALVASIRASSPPDAVESPTVSAFRRRRQFRGWTTHWYLLAQIRDLLAGPKNAPYPRPDDNSGQGFGGRRVIDLDEFGNF